MSITRFALPLMLACALVVALAGCATPNRRAASAEPTTPAGFHHPHARIFSGGQPDAAALGAFRELGVGSVINLRADAEMVGSDEAETTRALGLDYVRIPITGADDITPANAARLHQAIDAAPGAVLVHCASGNRVGALLAIDAALRRGLAVDEAVAVGKAAGLGSLEPRVREVLAHAEGEAASPAPEPPRTE